MGRCLYCGEHHAAPPKRLMSRSLGERSPRPNSKLEYERLGERKSHRGHTPAG